MTSQRADSTAKEKNAAPKAKESGEEDCRCKEVSKKTVPELLKVMISDLAFWKRSRIKK